MKLRHRRIAPWAFAVTAVGGIVLAYQLLPEEQLPSGVFAALGLAGGFAGFFYSDGREQTRLFHELSRDFNDRYDRDNGKLAVALESAKTSLTPEQVALLVDYFNLCGGEYLFWKAGYVPDEVWRAWCRGKLHYLKVPAVAELFTREIVTDSYYGLTVEVIERGAG